MFFCFFLTNLTAFIIMKAVFEPCNYQDPSHALLSSLILAINLRDWHCFYTHCRRENWAHSLLAEIIACSLWNWGLIQGHLTLDSHMVVLCVPALEWSAFTNSVSSEILYFVQFLTCLIGSDWVWFCQKFLPEVIF